MNAADRSSCFASRISAGLAMMLLSLAAGAAEPAHAPAPPQKLPSPPVLSIGTITIAPAAEPAKAAPSSHSLPRHSHKLRPGDLLLPTYLLDRA